MGSTIGDHIAYSKYMAQECITQLIYATPFKKLPGEWMTPAIKLGLDELSNNAGSWFEMIVQNNIRKLGIVGVRSIKKLKFKNGDVLDIPSDVGEIDFIGYSAADQAIIVLEFKLVGHATEPKYYRDDLNKFINSKKSYAKKFKNKYDWVSKNFSLVSKYIMETESVNTKPIKMGYAMITFYPTIAAEFIDDFDCISITKFINDYRNNNSWCFSIITL